MFIVDGRDDQQRRDRAKEATNRINTADGGQFETTVRDERQQSRDKETIEVNPKANPQS